MREYLPSDLIVFYALILAVIVVIKLADELLKGAIWFELYVYSVVCSLDDLDAEDSCC